MNTQLKKVQSLTSGSIPDSILRFALPLFLGQLLQQFYNMADAWVIGNFASNNAFAAVSSGGNLTFLIIGFFSGIGIGGGVVISRYFGAKDRANTQKAIHTGDRTKKRRHLYLYGAVWAAGGALLTGLTWLITVLF